MLKKMLVMLAAVFLMAGPALADSFTINSVSPGIGYVGQINLTVNAGGNVFDTWGYCIQQNAHSYIGQPYNGSVRDLDDSQLWQAQLIYDAYKNGRPGNQGAYDLQKAVWGSAGTFTGNNDLAALLRNMFKWADVYDINSNCTLWGQDFIIAKASPVPEPATLLLLGLGLVGMGVAARRRFVK